MPSDSTSTNLPFRIRIVLRVAEEDGMSAADPIPLTLEPDCQLEPLGDHLWRGVVTTAKSARIAFRSAPYDPTWTVQLVPEVLPVEEVAS